MNVFPLHKGCGSFSLHHLARSLARLPFPPRLRPMRAFARPPRLALASWWWAGSRKPRARRGRARRERQLIFCPSTTEPPFLLRSSLQKATTALHYTTLQDTAAGVEEGQKWARALREGGKAVATERERGLTLAGESQSEAAATAAAALPSGTITPLAASHGEEGFQGECPCPIPRPRRRRGTPSPPNPGNKETTRRRYSPALAAAAAAATAAASALLISLARLARFQRGLDGGAERGKALPPASLPCLLIRVIHTRRQPTRAMRPAPATSIGPSWWTGN